MYFGTVKIILQKCDAVFLNFKCFKTFDGSHFIRKKETARNRVKSTYYHVVCSLHYCDLSAQHYDILSFTKTVYLWMAEGKDEMKTLYLIERKNERGKRKKNKV